MTRKVERPKRGNGRGTVRKLPSGKWQWRATVTLPNGEIQRVAGTVATKTEAEDALSRVRTASNDGRFEVTAKTTLEEYIRDWHETNKAHQAATYARSHESMMNTHIIPGLGKLRLTSITPRDLEAFYENLQHRDPRREKMLGKPLGDSMKRLIHTMLHQVFANAVRLGELSRNPADVVRPRYTRQAAREVTLRAWTEDEAGRFYQVARQHPRGMVFCFMLATGLRIGEALGLRWENVDLKTGMIQIQESLVSVNGHKVRTTPKTARSRRKLKITGDALTILKEQPAKAALEWEASPERYQASDAVFTNTLGGPIQPDTVYGLMRQLCKEAKVPYKGTHVLRHSFISIQGLQGRPVEVISAHVGHARASFTQDRYRTVFEHERDELTLDFTAGPKPPTSGHARKKGKTPS
ncbi:tyrosine-type recombinase/integrase [Deinococcus taklimakanensis]|uniref:Tyrosine-type recombinase/integrase n=1 Tax=Deinococcus taklimakanensis TaxID=536443 RepID=A0ABW5P1M3_9DEIO